MKTYPLWLLTFSLAVAALSAAGTQEQAEEPALQAETEQTLTNTPSRKESKSRSRVNRDDRTMIGGALQVRAGEEVGDAVSIGGSAEVDGVVHGDLVVVMGKARIGPNAELLRDLTVVGGSLNLDPGAKIKGDRVVIGAMSNMPLPRWLKWPNEWVHSALLMGRPLPHQYAWSWGLALFVVLLLIALALLFPGPVQASIDALSNRTSGAFLTGLLALLLIAPLIVLLGFTVIGLVLVPFLVAGFLAALLLGNIAVCRYAGAQLGMQLGVEALQKPLLALLAGVVFLHLLYLVPVVGFVVLLAITPLALGAVLLAFFRRLRVEQPRLQMTTAPAVPVAVETASASGFAATGPALSGTEPASVTLMPRVGFWARLLATFLDLLFVGMVASLLHVWESRFLLLWTAYHIGMWTWKGTTLGGMILSIKIVRTDGGPVTFAVALIRSLSSFLSAVALFLGFFWAGWSADKQSWHDRIAGTCVVRVPRGMGMF